MPELPDVTVYVEALQARIVGRRIERVRVLGPSLLRSFDPPLEEVEQKHMIGVRRLAKRIVFEVEADLFLVLHLMIAGRLRWIPPGARLPGKISIGAFEFENGVLALTESATKKRASLHVVRGLEGLAVHNAGGLDVFSAKLADFASALRRENHTLKRALTDPRLIAGIGNAYSDEILHAARLSPVRLTHALADDETARLFESCRATLRRWTDVLRKQFEGRFPGPGEITAFRPDFAVHGRFEQPCPVCGFPVQRIRYAENETNYCPVCQTEGRMLADRSLSRLLKSDWPRTIEELDEPASGR